MYKLGTSRQFDQTKYYTIYANKIKRLHIIINQLQMLQNALCVGIERGTVKQSESIRQST